MHAILIVPLVMQEIWARVCRCSYTLERMPPVVFKIKELVVSGGFVHALDDRKLSNLMAQVRLLREYILQRRKKTHSTTLV